MPKITVHGGPTNASETVDPHVRPGEQPERFAYLADEPESADVAPGDEDEAPYSEWSVQELRDELDVRGLPTSGKKAELVERLEVDDEVTEDEDPE